MWYRPDSNCILNLDSISQIGIGVTMDNNENNIMTEWEITFFEISGRARYFVYFDTSEEARVEFEKITKMLIEKGA